jgi:hypothetical protein
MGPVSSAAWVAAAAGAATIPLLARRLGTRWTAFVLRIGLGLAVATMGLAGGVVGVVTALLATYAVHGALNPIHNARLHRETDAAHRASLISLNSMAGQPGSALGLVVLTTVASHLSPGIAMIAGAAVLAVAAPLYLVTAPAPRWSFKVSADGV